MSAPMKRINDLLVMGAADGEEARTAANLAAKLIAKYGLVLREPNHRPQDSSHGSYDNYPRRTSIVDSDLWVTWQDVIFRDIKKNAWGDFGNEKIPNVEPYPSTKEGKIETDFSSCARPMGWIIKVAKNDCYCCRCGLPIIKGQPIRMAFSTVEGENFPRSMHDSCFCFDWTGRAVALSNYDKCWVCKKSIFPGEEIVTSELKRTIHARCDR